MSARWVRIVMIAAVLSIALAGALSGCSASAQTQGPYDDTAGNATPASSSGGSGPGVQLVDVDPNQTLQAPPGQGVGVFTEYQSGGHWNVSWTCDTNVTSLSCHFHISALVGSGAISNLNGALASPGGELSQPSSNEVSATTLTTTLMDGITFDATPGAIITLNATIDGNENGSFLFFVQDGQVNGGYQGQFADPLMLEPASP